MSEVVTSQSWFQRLGNAFMGIIIGLILSALSFVFLTKNEKRSVNRYRALKEVAQQAVTVPAATIDAAHEGKVVHFTGIADT